MGNEHQALQLLGNYMQRSQNYWNQRSTTYDSPIPDVFGRNITASFLNKLKPKSLVEVGCGTGQLFPLYRNIPRVVGCDWTDGMLAKSKTRIQRHEYSNIKLEKLDITKEALKDHFDIALTRTVLMHITEDDVDEKGNKINPVKNACGNLAKMADTLLLFEFYNPNAPNLEWHNFHHEYPLLLREFGFEISEAFMRPDGLPQMLMIFTRQKENKQHG